MALNSLGSRSNGLPPPVPRRLSNGSNAVRRNSGGGDSNGNWTRLQQSVIRQGRAPPTVFTSVGCGICRKVPITGERFKCLQCPGFDLCGACVMRADHSRFHLFARLIRLEQAEFIDKILNWVELPRSNGQSLRAPSYLIKGLPVFPTGCDSCKVFPMTGARYKCMSCKAYDLCSRCASTGIHSHHIFAVVLTEAQENALRKIDWSLNAMIPSELKAPSVRRVSQVVSLI